MENHTLIVLVALILLTIIVVWALYLRIDGTLLAGVIGIFGYAVGYKHRTKRVPSTSF